MSGWMSTGAARPPPAHKEGNPGPWATRGAFGERHPGRPRRPGLTGNRSGGKPEEVAEGQSGHVDHPRRRNSADRSSSRSQGHGGSSKAEA